MDPFADHGKRATSNTPDRLIGVIKTRSAARYRYTDIVAELFACDDHDMLDAYLASIASDLAQFRAELDFLWEGDGEDFPGLKLEIIRARERIENSIPANPEYQDGGFRRSYQDKELET